MCVLQHVGWYVCVLWNLYGRCNLVVNCLFVRLMFRYYFVKVVSLFSVFLTWKHVSASRYLPSEYCDFVWFYFKWQRANADFSFVNNIVFQSTVIPDRTQCVTCQLFVMFPVLDVFLYFSIHLMYIQRIIIAESCLVRNNLFFIITTSPHRDLTDTYTFCNNCHWHCPMAYDN